MAGAGLAGQDQPRADQGLEAEALGARRAEQVVPALRRVPETEALGDLGADAAPGQVLPGSPRVVALAEPPLVAGGRPLEQPVEAVAGPGLRPLRRPAAGRERHPGPLGQEPDGLREVEPVVALEELEGVAPGVAAEAVEDAELRVDGEGRRLLLVEGAEALPALAGPLEGDVGADEVHEVHPRPDLLDDLRRHHHGLDLGWVSEDPRCPPRRRGPIDGLRPLGPRSEREARHLPAPNLPDMLQVIRIACMFGAPL